VTAFMKTKNLA